MIEMATITIKLFVARLTTLDASLEILQSRPVKPDLHEQVPTLARQVPLLEPEQLFKHLS